MGGVLIVQVTQNYGFVQYKGLGKEVSRKADDIFTEDLDHSFCKITGFPWSQLALVQATMIQSPEDFFRV